MKHYRAMLEDNFDDYIEHFAKYTAVESKD
jgi:hypothetical protein